MENNFDQYETAAHIPTLREEQVRLTQQRILDTFETELMNNGYSSVSIRLVARHAGMSVPTVYRYYSNKEALLVALMDASEAEAGFNPFSILASTQEPMEVITKLLDGMWEQIERHPGRTKAVLQAITEANDEAEPAFEVLRRVDFMAREALTPLSYLPGDKLHELQAMVALLLGPQTWYALRVGHGLTRERARAVVLDTIKAALEASKAQAPRPGNKHLPQPGRTEEALRERLRQASKEFGAVKQTTND
jgi:AcrR family transcriptional regulator